MIVNIGVSASFLIMILIITFNFFSKEKINKIENKIFKYLVIITIFGLIIELFFYWLAVFSYQVNNALYILLIKSIYIYYVFWMFYFVLYNFCLFFSITSNKQKIYKKFLLFIGPLYFIFLLLTIILPVTLDNNIEYLYPGGIGTSTQYIIVSFGMILISIISLRNIKLLSNKLSLPMISCFILGIISTIVQYYHHEFMFIVPSHAIAVIFMYFTIENPDLKMLRELELAKNQAEKANRAKTDFLSSMSHEIRTPLNAIVGLSNIIKDSDNLDEIHEDAKDVVSASNTLLEIVNGILDISRIEADKMEIIETNYNPLEELKSLANLAETRIGDKEIELRNYFAVDLPETLYGDKGKVKQIITNLLTNAAKYTEKGYIDFKVSCINENNICKLTISVTDTGRGIKKEQMDTLFTKFNRLEEDKNTTIEGTGLGLAITKSLVEMMGGKIVVDSTYGEGSKFTVFLSQKITNDVVEKANTSVSTFADKKVLIVDDNKLNLKVAVKILKEFNLDIDTCESGFECLEKIANNDKYDIIFMDIMMPKMDGVETLKKLKQIEAFNIPVVALTADAMEGKANKYLEEGFVNYLSKPIDREELNKVLNKIIK